MKVGFIMFDNLRNVLYVSENILSALSHKRSNAIDIITTLSSREDELNDWENSDLSEAKEILVQLEIVEKALMKHLKDSM